ncbi:NADPH-dependent FMN reductase [Tropicimonas isoalkanivorans]|uniref:NAD(P)H-dependent FMN reductase n=1 Tax=Tropicimonas isoalkanivorans TaxID=441112 RepID=A0A1I1G7A8_9RHOB|nr:NAD(P)H-dependent oxidoreductase [Tropicimonas isoalkanivorans]SFC07222.1 NAD(P)H-dependent FMN reductase [Tropicimonas isoalkanivorans]
MKLNVIITSTRPGRVGKPVGDWIYAHARENEVGFDTVLTDLAELELPMLDEPNHPKAQKYQHEHTRKWSEIVEGSDAFVLVIPEYNFTMPATLVNALDYLYNEWAYKPVSFVSYGGVSGGLRSVQSSKGVLTALRMMPIPEQVTIPMVFDYLKDDAFVAEDIHKKSADTMLAELAKWSRALKGLREAA